MQEKTQHECSPEKEVRKEPTEGSIWFLKETPAKRLSTAFDSVTLYGFDPHERPDIYGKVGNSGVSICTLDDMKKLYSGFNLCDPSTSVSMTINGPAPMILAMFLNTAIDQQVELFLKQSGKWDQAEMKIIELLGGSHPTYTPYGPDGPEASLPPGPRWSRIGNVGSDWFRPCG